MLRQYDTPLSEKGRKRRGEQKRNGQAAKRCCEDNKNGAAENKREQADEERGEEEKRMWKRCVSSFSSRASNKIRVGTEKAREIQPTPERYFRERLVDKVIKSRQPPFDPTA